MEHLGVGQKVALTNYHWTALVLFLLALPACAQSFNFKFAPVPDFLSVQPPTSCTTPTISSSEVGQILRAHLKMNAEFMFQGIPVNQDIIKQVGVSDIRGRLYALSGNLMIGTSIGGRRLSDWRRRMEPPHP